MGAAIDVFDGALAVRVPRSRFLPVKTTDDLLVLRSDAFALDADARVVLDGSRGGAVPRVRLDPGHYKLVDDFEARFPAGAPSLVGCDALTVRGDVSFGADVVVRGDVTLEAGAGSRTVIAAGTVLTG
jgi:UTP--glucose-1-phosphate uridylyltransferase